jgi:3-deoxy-7-phosphoheptulonate synthase
VTLGGGDLVLLAGPCSVESQAQVLGLSTRLAADGAHLLRGGAFKPRSNPYSFQGLRHEGLKLLKQASQASGLPVITEVMSLRDLDAVAEVADVIQVGARLCQHFELLHELGRIDRPVLLKRGLDAPRSRSCCWPPSTSSPTATPRGRCSASAASAPSSRPRAITCDLHGRAGDPEGAGATCP